MYVFQDQMKKLFSGKWQGNLPLINGQLKILSSETIKLITMNYMQNALNLTGVILQSQDLKMWQY